MRIEGKQSVFHDSLGHSYYYQYNTNGPPKTLPEVKVFHKTSIVRKFASEIVQSDNAE